MISAAFLPYLYLILLGLMLVLVFKEILRPSVGFLSVVVLLLITGVMQPQDLLAGFSNDKIASIILLILITSAIRKNFRLETLFDNIFGTVSSYRVFLVRMMSQVALLSSFINNTPVVALMSPYVVEWGRKNNVAPSRLLIPLSYAAIMGGMLTIIGTSTTLLLNGFLDDYSLPGISPLALLVTGFAVTFLGIIFLTISAPYLLPSRKDVVENFEENPGEYLVETHLASDSDLVGKTVKDAGLRNLKGVYLVEVIRNEEVIHPVPPDFQIHKEDKLFFAGNTSQVMDLINSNSGVVLPPALSEESSSEHRDLAECVIPENSSIVGKTVKQSNFRTRYDAAVVAIQRAGMRLSGKIGDYRLRPGDLLLLYAGNDFFEKVDLYRDLYVVDRIASGSKTPVKNILVFSMIIISLSALAYFETFSLFSTLLVILAIMIFFKLITMREIKRELDLDLIAILVFSLVIGEGMVKTGAGSLIANGILELFSGYGNIALMGGIMFLTMMLTSFINNAAAVSIAFPITYSLVQSQSLDGSAFYLAIAFAASGSFITPFGYQTNLIVYGPGGYRMKDFFKAGFPTSLLYLLVSLIFIILLHRDTLL